MALIVQKYGGTSVAGTEKIENVAGRVINTVEAGNDVVVVLSAMAGETDRLVSLAHSLADKPDKRECDVLVSTGEQVTVSLLAIALNRMGYRAKSILAHQVKVITDRNHQDARILRVDNETIEGELKKGYIVIVTGFQGVDMDGNITTLGRGGSDTTAVALAAALQADVCEIYTDVEGVYTADPSLCFSAVKLTRLSYDEMLEMASAGAKVLHPRSVELAKKYEVPVYVKSSFNNNGGTLITKEDREMERVIVSGVTYDRDQAKITVVHVPDRPGVAARVFTPISDKNIVVDMIIQNASIDGYTDLTFTISRRDIDDVKEILQTVVKDVGAQGVEFDENISKVSIVGVGMRSHAGVASKMFSSLADEGINVKMISTSEIKISCVIEAKYTELAVMALHDAFELGK